MAFIVSDIIDTTTIYTHNSVIITTNSEPSNFSSSTSCKVDITTNPHIQITIRYPLFSIEEHLEDHTIINSMFCKNGETSICETINNYISTLSPANIDLITKAYAKYGSIVNGFMAELGAYMGFLMLCDNREFMASLPFHFNPPHPKMIDEVTMPVAALCNLMTGTIKQLIDVVQHFVRIWRPLFIKDKNETIRKYVAEHINTKIKDDIKSYIKDIVTDIIKPEIETYIYNGVIANILPGLDKLISKRIAEEVKRNMISRDEVKEIVNTELERVENMEWDKTNDIVFEGFDALEFPVNIQKDSASTTDEQQQRFRAGSRVGQRKTTGVSISQYRAGYERPQSREQKPLTQGNNEGQSESIHSQKRITVDPTGLRKRVIPWKDKRIPGTHI